MSYENRQTLLIVTPSFYRNITKEIALVKHFTEVADYAAKPIVISNLPGNTSVNMSAEGRASAKIFCQNFEVISVVGKIEISEKSSRTA